MNVKRFKPSAKEVESKNGATPAPPPTPQPAPPPQPSAPPSPPAFTSAAPKPSPSSEKRTRILNDLKSSLHVKLIDLLDLEVLTKVDKATAQKEIHSILLDLIRQQPVPISGTERIQVIKEIVDETFGLGPLETLLADETVDEILVNNHRTVFIERKGRLELSGIRFKDEAHLRHIINRIVARIGRRIDDASPMVDARLPDGSRVNAIIPPLALDGPSVSIRKFRDIPLSVEELVKIGSMTQDMITILKIAVQCRMNILISGGTGTGKTTLLNALSSFIPPEERILTIEDAAELRLQQPHVVRLETRPPNMEGKGQISQRELVRNSLRMRPDRIVIGEVRGAEAMDMLQAMNTGHDGSITTIHANTARDALGRLETMVLMAVANLDQHSINKQIVSAINLIIQIKRFPDGKRRIEALTEVTGMEGNTISLQEIAFFVSKGRDSNGNTMGLFKMNPVKPRFFQRAEDMGIPLPSSLTFDD